MGGTGSWQSPKSEAHSGKLTNGVCRAFPPQHSLSRSSSRSSSQKTRTSVSPPHGWENCPEVLMGQPSPLGSQALCTIRDLLLQCNENILSCTDCKIQNIKFCALCSHPQAGWQRGKRDGASSAEQSHSLLPLHRELQLRSETENMYNE